MDTDLPQTICGVKVELEAPTSFAERMEVSMALREAIATGAPTEKQVRLFAAALGLCWGRLRRFIQKQKRAEYGGDLAKWGGIVLDFFGEQPEKPHIPSVIKAGRRAIELCEQQALTESAIKGAEGFSAPPAASSSSNSSPSSDAGGESLAGSAPSPPPQQHG